MGLSNRDEMSTSLSGDARGIFCESLKLIHPAVWEEMRNTHTHTHTEGVASENKIIDYLDTIVLNICHITYAKKSLLLGNS